MKSRRHPHCADSVEPDIASTLQGVLKDGSSREHYDPSNMSAYDQQALHHLHHHHFYAPVTKIYAGGETVVIEETPYET